MKNIDKINKVSKSLSHYLVHFIIMYNIFYINIYLYNITGH